MVNYDVKTNVGRWRGALAMGILELVLGGCLFPRESRMRIAELFLQYLYPASSQRSH